MSDIPSINAEQPVKSNYRNVLFMSICFFGIFFSFNSSQALQTSLGDVQGYINLACLYGMFSVFSIFGPKVVSMMNPTYAMFAGGVTYAAVVISNFFSKYAIVQIVANLVVGVGAAILWNAEGVYIGRCALWDSRTSSKGFGETTSSYNGVFFGIFQFCGCAGTLTSGIILNFFSDKNLLLTVLTVVAVIAVICIFFLPSVKSYESAMSANGESDSASLSETFSLLCHSKKLVMMLPIIIFNGMCLAFIFGDITGKIATPAFGKSWAMYITAVFYGVNALISYIIGGGIGKWISRKVACLLAFLSLVIAFVLLIVFPIPKDTHEVKYYIIAIAMIVFIAMGDAIWESQPPAILQSFYGLDRERNAAMANFKLWQSLGFCIQFAIGAVWSDTKYLMMKYCILLALLVIGYGFMVYLDARVQKIDMKKGESAALLSQITSK